jgi:hypothetical protein
LEFFLRSGLIKNPKILSSFFGEQTRIPIASKKEYNHQAIAKGHSQKGPWARNKSQHNPN